MSKAQRATVDAMLRQGPQGFTPLPVEEMRSNFAALMALFPVPKVRTSDTMLGERPAVLVETEGQARPGTICTFTAARSPSDHRGRRWG